MKKLIFTLVIFAFASFTYAQTQAVLSVSPNQNTVNVPLTSDIKSYFNQSMNGSTFDGTSVMFYGSMTGKKQGTITYNPGNNSMQIVPNNPFKVGEFVSTTLNSGIKTSSGNPIAPFVWNFTTMVKPTNACFNFFNNVNLGNGPSDSKTGDFDGDGDLDLAVINASDNDISIFKNNGTGTFSQTSTVSVGITPMGLATGDFDRDGDLDLAVVHYGSHDVYILINDGGGFYTVSSSVIAGPYSFQISSSDFDGDGDLDLAVTSRYGGLAILKNNGTGLFALSSAIGYPEGFGITLADFDGDGDIDIATTTYYTNLLYIFKNDGNGFFTINATINISCWQITSADFDGDGDVDIAVTGNPYGLNHVFVLKNDGNGIFTLSSTVAVSSWGIASSDCDGDGDIDLEVVSFGLNSLIILKNNNDGTFLQTSIISVGNQPVKSTTGDFDGDGDLDYAVINSHWQSRTISILMNLSPPQLLSPADNSTGIPLNFTWKKSAGAANYRFQIATDSLFSNLVEDSALPGTDSVKYVSGLSPATPLYYWRMNSTSANGVSLWSDIWKFNICSPLNVSMSSNPTIYFGYGAGNATLNVTNVTGGTSPYTYLWSPGGLTTQSIVVNPTVTTSYSVTVTDKNNCTGSGSVTVIVKDVRCGNKNDKVLVCHNGNEICISPSAVPAHLAHGDKLGHCGDNPEIVTGNLPTEFKLNPNYPNPFNPVTKISFDIPEQTFVSLKIYDALGREVKTLVNDLKAPGNYVVDFNGSELSSGVYFYRLQSAEFTDIKRMLLIK